MGETSDGAVPADEQRDVSIDAFHRGAFHLVQPLRRGHRAGMDAMVLAAAVPSSFAGHLADLGAGAGAAGLAVAARCPGARVTLVERSAEMAGHARATLALAGNRALAARISLIEADVALTGRARIAAGLAERSYDHVVMNPPFNPASYRPSPEALRQEAHMMDGELFEKWLRTAAAISRPRAGLAVIARPQSLPAIIDAMAGRYGQATIVPVHARPAEAAIRIVVRAVRGARAPLSIAPPFFLHEREGNAFSPRATAIVNGEACLFAD